jgi:nicotinamidase-related amidase
LARPVKQSGFGQPHAVYVGRKGEVNAWDNEDFVKAVRVTGKKTLIMAGVWTSVCVMSNFDKRCALGNAPDMEPS